MTSLNAAGLASIDARLPMYRRIAQLVERVVEFGGLGPGDALPPESQLAADCGVALGTVRRALDSLREDGVIERHQGRGTFVRQPDFHASLLRFFRFGDGVGTLPEGRVLMVNRELADAATAAVLGLGTDSEVLALRRVRSLRGMPVAWERIWLPSSAFGVLAGVPATDFPNLLYPWYQTRCGVLVSRATEELTIGRAEAEDTDLLGGVAGDPVVVIERRATTITGQPVERRITRGLATTFRYRVEIS